MDPKALVKIAKALSDPTRLLILHQLAQAPPQVTWAALFEVSPASQPSMSQHVKVLVESGLVESNKQGRYLRLSVNPKKLQPLECFLALFKRH